MSRFQTLIRSRDSPLNIKTLILVAFIDAAILMPELTNGYVENVTCTNKNVVFLKITISSWIILTLHPGHTSLFLKTVTTEFMRLSAEGHKWG